MALHEAALAALRAVATECQELAAGFSDGQAAEGMVITEELRAIFHRPATASSYVAGPAAQLPGLLSVVPPELLSIIMSHLDTRALACLAATCGALWCGAPTPHSALPPGLVETELRRRAEARGLHIDLTLPEGVLSWVPYLLKRDFYGALRREAPLAVGTSPNGSTHGLFVDRDGGLHLACRHTAIKAGDVGEPLLAHEWGSDHGFTVPVPPTLVPSMQGRRIVSVATSDRHCLALNADGKVYSWGADIYGALGHADVSAVVGPRRIETLERVESIAVGSMFTSAAVDDRGRLFTWGRATWGYEPTGLGHELDPGTDCQRTPKRVDALLEDRVVGVALGPGLTLAVIDAGAVFYFGFGFGLGLGGEDTLDHGSFKSEVLPRRIQALAVTGRRFVAVAAGEQHCLALTAEGQVYGWGLGYANGHGQDQDTPKLVAALAGERVALVYAHGGCSCAVAEKGEFYAWGRDGRFNLGHGVDAPQQTPKRMEALRHVKVVAAAVCDSHTLAADADGVVWAFGAPFTLGLGGGGTVVQPTPIPNLRVRTLP